MRALAPVLIVLLGCAARAPQAQSAATAGSADARVEALERRVDSMEKELTDLRALDERLTALANAVQEISLAVARLEGRTGADPKGEGEDEHGSAAALPDMQRYPVRTDGSPSVGPKAAKVTIVQVFEFACPFCERTRETLKQIRSTYGKDVRIVFRNFIVHPDQATRPALAACAAAKQGKFEPVYEGIWEKAFKARDFSDTILFKVATDAGVKDMKRFARDMDGACVKEVAADQRFFSEIGVQGTPTFYVNGRLISGAQPYVNFAKMIEEELTTANEALKKGAKLKTYYERLIQGNR